LRLVVLLLLLLQLLWIVSWARVLPSGFTQERLRLLLLPQW
jgi:hypothetical protein